MAEAAVEVCAAALCEGAVYAKGHCSRHYRQLLRTGQITPERTAEVCAVPTCDRRAVTRGWCHGHYVRWHRTGDVQADRPLRRDVVDVCVIDGCGRGATSGSYCRTHYNRSRQHGDPLAGGPIRLVTGDGALSHGYWTVVVPPHQRHLVPPGRTKELQHRLVMAEVLGRPLLPEETVHHKNGDRLDNDPANLELWSTAQPKGQRVDDKLAFARRLIELYDPDMVRTLGWDLDPETGLPRNEQWPTAGAIDH